eukprot:1833856-Prymnesium_polylepis.1
MSLQRIQSCTGLRSSAAFAKACCAYLVSAFTPRSPVSMYPTAFSTARRSRCTSRASVNTASTAPGSVTPHGSTTSLWAETLQRSPVTSSSAININGSSVFTSRSSPSPPSLVSPISSSGWPSASCTAAAAVGCLPISLVAAGSRLIATVSAMASLCAA